VAAFEPGRLAASYAPPALAAELGTRFLVVFAFMQTMHYVVWVAVLPRFAPEAAARFDARVPALRGGRAWLLGAGLALVLGVVFALDYAQGKTLYAAGATYHAYLEFPVLLALVLAYPKENADDPGPSHRRRSRTARLGQRPRLRRAGLPVRDLGGDPGDRAGAAEQALRLGVD
jgi:hypothetical protein